MQMLTEVQCPQLYRRCSEHLCYSICSKQHVVIYVVNAIIAAANIVWVGLQKSTTTTSTSHAETGQLLDLEY